MLININKYSKKHLENQNQDEINEIDEITGEQIPIKKSLKLPISGITIKARSIAQVLDILETEITNLTNRIKLIERNIQTHKKIIKKEYFTIETSNKRLLHFENPINALDKIDEMIKRNEPFKMNKKLQNIYLHVTKDKKKQG